jgi:MFS family permease
MTNPANSAALHEPGVVPSSGYAWYVVACLFLAYVVSFLDRQILSLLIEPIKADLQISDTIISLLHGFTFAIFYTLFGIPLGRLADSHNRKAIIIGSISLWSLMTMLCGFAKNAPMLFAARVGVAVGEAGLSPSAYSIISDYFPREKRGRAISVYSLGIFVGAGMAYIFGGLVAEFAMRAVDQAYPIIGQFKAWQLTFVLTGLPGVFIVMLMLTVREPGRSERYSARQGSVPFKEVFAYFSQHRKLYGALLIGNGFIAMANYSLFAWLPAFFIRVYDYTPRTIGVTFGLMLLSVGTSGLLTGAYIADNLFRRGSSGSHMDTMIVMTALAIFPAAGLFMYFDVELALICVAITVFFTSASTGLVPASFQLATPNELRGQVTALYLFLTSAIGLSIGPTAVALITDQYYGDPLAVGKSLSITLCSSIVIGVLLFLVGRRAYARRIAEMAELR